MKEDIKIVIGFLEKMPTKYQQGGAEDILDALYQCYADNLKGDSAFIKGQFQQLNNLLCDLSICEQDLVVDNVCRLCGAYQKDAYKDGMVTGFHLCRELEIED